MSFLVLPTNYAAALPTGWSYLAAFTVLLLSYLGLAGAGTKNTPSKPPSNPNHATLKVPGPWYTSVSSAWFFWQRWNGQLSPASHRLLLEHGDETNSIVRLSPGVVLLNDYHALKSFFGKSGPPTGTRIVRALMLAGHPWSITEPDFDTVRPRRTAVQAATTKESMQPWTPEIEAYLAKFIATLRAAARTSTPQDIIRPLRRLTVELSTLALVGRPIPDDLVDKILDSTIDFNKLVAWRLCMPTRLLEAIDVIRTYLPSEDKIYSPLRWSRSLSCDVNLIAYAKRLNALGERGGNPSSAYHRQRAAMEASSSGGVIDENLLAAETAGGLVAGTETMAASLVWLLFELSRRPDLVARIHSELDEPETIPGKSSFLDICIKEELRFRGPVALTSNRIVPPGGATVLGGKHFLPEGTVVVMHNYSLSRRDNADGGADRFDPDRWLTGGLDEHASDRTCAPFGIGIRRCPGKPMASDTLRIVTAAVVRKFTFSCPPETTEEGVRSVELNGNRPAGEFCRLVFEERV